MNLRKKHLIFIILIEICIIAYLISPFSSALFGRKKEEANYIGITPLTITVPKSWGKAISVGSRSANIVILFENGYIATFYLSKGIGDECYKIVYR